MGWFKSRRRLSLAVWLVISLGITLGAGIMTPLALRSNYVTMDRLRSQVFEADRNDGDIEVALKNLRRHVVSHMNTDLVKVRHDQISGPDDANQVRQSNTEKPIQLVHKYYRDSLAYHDWQLKLYPPQVQAVLPQARAVCETDLIGPSERLSCLQTQTRLLGGQDYPAIEALPKVYYVFDFVSPDWSWDRAGWSIFWLFFGLINLVLVLIVSVIRSARILLVRS